MKLTQILKEIKVNQPLNKMKAFKDILDFDEDMLCNMIQYDTLNSFMMDGYGYDSLEELLNNEFEVDNLQQYLSLITNYYNVVKPGDIIFIGGKITPIMGCKNAIELTRDIGDRELDRYYLALKF
jgi:hypothetical protein